MRLAMIVAFVLCVCLPSLSARGQGDDEQERVRRLVKQLGAEKHSDREAATRELLEIGGPAAAPLEEAAKGDDPEVRERATAILVTVRPLAGLASPDRQERIRASLEVCAKTSDYVTAGSYQVKDAPKVILLMSSAVRANPDLMNSGHVRRCLEAARPLLDGPAKAAFEATDVGHCLTGDLARLAEKYPAGPLTGKVIYDAGKFADYLRQFPQGFYAPRAQYCLIAGKKKYSYTERDRREPMRVKNPDAELAAWPEFLKKHPDFEGADDANYRYARALEMKGKLAEACLRLRLRYPDGDMASQSVERLLFIMDARMDAKQLAAAQQAFEGDKRPDAELLLPAAQVRPVVNYLQALKLSREGEYAAAAAAFRIAAKESQGVGGKVDDPPAVRTLPVPVRAESSKGSPNLLVAIVQRAGTEADLCEQCAALAGKPDGDKLYQLASLLYKHRSPAPLGRLPFSPFVPSSYSAAENAAEFYLKSCKYWQAARIYRRVLDDYPGSQSAAKALYMLANCHCHMAEIATCEFWRMRQKDNVKTAIGRYRSFAEKYPDHELAPLARKAVEVLTKKWFPPARPTAGRPAGSPGF